ncbi:MAG TPA: marine proteobacterial sortase target protein [Usitatibacter sp.]|jgi:Ca-activated chloride channel family protein|nr:marine proteobacterial sortase target protein [Usitatibacter sp.]
MAAVKATGARGASAWIDFLVLGAKAFASGLLAAVVLGCAALVLASHAQAADTVTLKGPKAGELLLRTDTAGQYVVAPTVETEVAIQVTGMVARTKVTQAFQNPGSDFVEGLYVFPLPEKAAVDHLALQVGARVIEGQVREKEEARRAYEAAKSQGLKAALVEQQRPNLFTNSVAHIGPGETVRVTIEYQQALAWDNGVYKLRFPLAVTPRYVPQANGNAIDASGPPILSPAYADAAAPGPVNPVDIAVLIDAGVPIANVTSSYHDAALQKAADGRMGVTLAKDQEEADHDFELTWTLAPGGSTQGALFRETIGDREYALVMLVPPEPGLAQKAARAQVPRESILIVDTSGSMAGTSLAQAKAALAQALDSLTPRDRFNVVEFNSILRPFSNVSLPASAANLAAAQAWVGQLHAGGGTEMEPALSFALGGEAPAGYLKQVVFMTDGGVANEDALFSLIAARLGNARLFTVGIGSAPNTHFMTKAAEFGRGTFTYIGDVREVRQKMSALFAKIEAPVVQDVSITWPDGSPVETFPARIPDLYLGEPIVVSAQAASFAGTVVVSGRRGNEPWSVALTPAASQAGVGALWARAKIASLMDAVTRGADVATVRPAVVQVALEHHLVSAYTSLVAVDVTPTGPSFTKTAMVRSSLPRGAGEIAGALPQTATAAGMELLMGLLALGLAALVAVIGWRAA